MPHEHTEHPVQESPERARQARRGAPVLVMLVVSVTLAIAALVTVFVVMEPQVDGEETSQYYEPAEPETTGG